MAKDSPIRDVALTTVMHKGFTTYIRVKLLLLYYFAD